MAETVNGGDQHCEVIYSCEAEFCCMTKLGTKLKRTSSPLWHRALERYREELHQNDDYQSVTEIASLEDLLLHNKAIEDAFPRDRTAISALQRLGTTLKFVDDFSAVIAVCFGADAKLTAFVWGSIRLMLTLASSAGDTLKSVLDMLEELSLTLPWFRAYELTLKMDRNLEAALVDVYTEVICFYARCIYFFRKHPHVLLCRDAWEDFRDDFARTLRRIRRLSATVENEADFARMRQEPEKYDKILDLIENLKDTKVNETEMKPKFHVPSTLSPRFWGREDVLQFIHNGLAPSQNCHAHQLKTLALYGIRYRDAYKVVLWVAADTAISLGQSFREIAKLLELAHTEQDLQDTNGCMLKVKNWLTSTSGSWIVVFDNADDLETLRHAWPTSGGGAVLLASRNANASYSPASKGYSVKSFDDSDGSESLLSLTGIDATSSVNRGRAKGISKTLGGLPLALTQIGGFIAQRKLPLQDFLPLYERNAFKIDARKTGMSDYEHTLSTAWDMSINQVSGDAQKLLDMIPYLQPDEVHETTLLTNTLDLGLTDYSFLDDQMDLGDAEEILLITGLISKNAENAAVSVHRLIQKAILRAQSPETRKHILHVVIQLLLHKFPNTFSEDKSHQVASWVECEKNLPHVNHIVTLKETEYIEVIDPQAYGELLLRCSWHLYEREVYDIATVMIAAALTSFTQKSTLAYASAIELSGLIDMDMNYPEKALKSYQEALSIRKQVEGESGPLVAASLNTIAMAYTEMSELEKAQSTHEEALEMRIRIGNKSEIGNSCSNFSSTLLKKRKPDDAEAMMCRNPLLQEADLAHGSDALTDEVFIARCTPRFSGTMLLLSHIRVQQRRYDEALQLASRSLQFRREVFGNRLKTCDALYDVASLMDIHGNTASAIELLSQLANVAASIPEGKGQLARAYLKLSLLHKKMERAELSAKFRELAVKLRLEIKQGWIDAPVEEEEFMKLVP
ncbi:hypothetical protein EK21DRAFT_97087 [Setomelanomma holmii]|uniref:Uncharacterized protein n=1 Tax=Setomelanomma holmii TaxID=210430 RepID=A0A9P4HI44_9PLEO|nr:hypothetical protein EK21DRAFT_97087 [Setomelanomma holmii]